MNPANLLADLEEFVDDHRRHGPMTGDATEQVLKGYLLTVTCPCGVVFERWVTSLEADADLISWSCLEASKRLSNIDLGVA